MTFGQRLTDLREEKGIYQRDLAVALNVSISTISNYENNVHYPDVTILCKLADFFDVSIDYLLGRTEYCHSLDTLNHKLSKHYTVAEFANTAIILPPQVVSNLLEYMEFLVMRNQNR